MIITNLKGGLGNQMFQYACGYALAKEYNTRHKLDISYYSSIPSDQTKREFELFFFKNLQNIATDEEIEKLKGKSNSILHLLNKINTKVLTIFTNLYPIQKYFGAKSLYLDGYFQNEKFFLNYREDILKEFTLKQNLQTEEYQRIKKKIENERDTISIHIRRGDYVSDRKTTRYHGVLEKDYYMKALRILDYSNKNRLYIFSDDIDWVKKNFEFLPKNSYYVSKHHFNSAQEIILMSLCKYNIIANSSFSWWGAWLNKNKKKIVIAPSNWTLKNAQIYSKIVPNSWTKI